VNRRSKCIRIAGVWVTGNITSLIRTGTAWMTTTNKNLD
jgi:hypothetical protein